MESINKLSKISELIGKFLFYSIIILLTIASIVMSLTRLGDKPGVITSVLVLVGTFIVIVLFYIAIRALFRPIYNLNKNIQLKKNNELTQKEFKKQWIISLICSLFFGVIFIIGTFGLSFLLMIPHYILLSKTKNL